MTDHDTASGSNDANASAIPPGFRQWIPAAAAFAMLLVVVGTGFVFASGSGGTSPSQPTGGGTTVGVVVATEASIDTTPNVTSATAKVALVRTLSQGDGGDDVRRIQERLADLPFDPGPIDGVYGQMTRRAVWASEKMVLGIPREEMTGEVTPEMWDRMQEPVVIAPRRRTGSGTTHTEVCLVEQVVAVCDDDRAVLVTHASSGDGEEWCDTVTYDTDPYGNPLDESVEREVCGIPKTPGGVFSFTRKVKGIRESPLGSLWNPVYFNYGIAIHGAINVPAYPTSHGCVRIPMHFSDYFQSLVNIGDSVFVWNGEKEPEDLTKRETLPVFDYPNPDATTTTMTTVPTTTTTVPTTTTTVPATTTTAAAPTSTASQLDVANGQP